MVYLWLGLLIFFVILEILTVGLQSIWFALGALVAMVATSLGADLWLQILLFFAVSIAMLLCLRPFLKKVVTPHIAHVNADSIIGKQAIVTELIDNLISSGYVTVENRSWAARSTKNEKISVGETVVIDKIEGVKVFVTKI